MLGEEESGGVNDGDMRNLKVAEDGCLALFNVNVF